MKKLKNKFNFESNDDDGSLYIMLKLFCKGEKRLKIIA